MKNSKWFGIVLGLGLAMGFGSASAEPRENGRYSDGDRHSDSYYRCRNCGRVERIEEGRGRRNSGAVAGAVIGGAIGNQVGSGDGRRAATVAGAILGGIAGNNAERRSSQRRVVYDILVRFDRGDSVWISQSELRGVREGSRVEVRSGRVRLR